MLSVVLFLALAAQAAQKTADRAGESWLSENSTLIVAIVGIVVSGLIGPSVASWWAARGERQNDKRAVIVARRDDLRELIDEAARVLGGAVANLRPLLAAELKGEPTPKEPADFLSTLAPLGQRLRLRLPGDHPVVSAYDQVRSRLIALAAATESQAHFDAAVKDFEVSRASFLDEGRATLQAPIVEDKEI